MKVTSVRVYEQFGFMEGESRSLLLALEQRCSVVAAFQDL